MKSAGCRSLWKALAIVTSQWGHLVACGAGIALDREYQCRSLYGLENWAFITNACTNAKDFTCSKLNWNDVPRFMLPAVFYLIQFIRDVNFPTILKCMNTNFQTMFFFSIMSHKVPVVQWFILLKTKATQANRLLIFFFFFFFLPWSYGAVIFQTNLPHINSAWKHTTGFENKSMCKFSQEL